MLLLHAESSALQMFHQGAGIWGFTTFMPLEDVLDDIQGFLMNDKLEVSAFRRKFILMMAAKLDQVLLLIIPSLVLGSGGLSSVW